MGKRRLYFYLIPGCAALAAVISLWITGTARSLHLHLSHFLQSGVLYMDAVSAPTRLAHLPAEVTDISTYDALTFDPRREERGILSYRLSKPTWVRIRIVWRGQKDLLLRTLVDWSPRDEGAHSEAWDGRDASGNIVDNRRCFFLFDTGDGIHGKHDWKRCRELKIALERPAAMEEVTSRRCSFEVAIDNRDSAYRTEKGYTVRLYVDHGLKATHRYPPHHPGRFAFAWDAAGEEEGLHRVTVVVDDGHDHLGTVSRDIFLREKAE